MKTMRKKHQIYQSPRVKIEQLPKAFCPSETAGNIQTQKERFLKHGKTPIFVIKGDTASVEELSTKANGHIRFEYLGEAEYILRKVKEEYGVGENYLDHIYGPRIKQEEANDLLMDYINKNSLHESLDVFWSHNITCSARMVWRGLNNKCNKPESRRYSLWVNGTEENPYLRRTGFVCLLDHEIGTHFFRTFNDGLQPWFSDRKRFDLRSAFSFEAQCTEEGLAAIHTALRAGEHYLWLAALVYYTACKSTEMTFRQLFDHIEQFIQNPEQRWKHVMRVKRGLVDPNDLGGYGKDQCYFEGAVNILRNIDTIDFALLMSGKICYDEVNRIKRLARMNCIHLPAFMRDMEKYRAKLKQMAVLNGLNLLHPLYEPSPKYLWRLQQRQAGIKPRTRKVRKKRKLHASLSKVSHTGSEESVGSSVQASSSCVSCSESTDSILSFNMDSLLTGYLPRNTAVEQEQEKENIKQRQTPTGGLADKIGASLMETYMSKPKEELEKRVILLRTIKNKAAGDGRQKMADGPSMAHKTQSSLIQAARERIGSGSSSKSQSEAAREWIGSGSSKSQSQAARERIGSGSSSKSQSQAARELIGSCSSGKSQSQAARAQIGSGSSKKSQSEVAREQIGSGSSSNSHTLSVCKQSLSEAGGRHLEDGGRSSGASHEPSAKVNNKQSLDDATEDTDGHCVTLQRLSLGVAEKHTGYLPRLATCSGLKEVSGVLEDNSVMAHIDQLSISGTQTPSSACDLVKESAGAVLADIDSQKKSVVVFTPLQMTGRTDADGVTKRRINNTFMQTPSMAETWSTSGEGMAFASLGGMKEMAGAHSRSSSAKSCSLEGTSFTFISTGNSCPVVQMKNGNITSVKEPTIVNSGKQAEAAKAASEENLRAGDLLKRPETVGCGKQTAGNPVRKAEVILQSSSDDLIRKSDGTSSVLRKSQLTCLNKLILDTHDQTQGNNLTKTCKHPTAHTARHLETDSLTKHSSNGSATKARVPRKRIGPMYKRRKSTSDSVKKIEAAAVLRPSSDNSVTKAQEKKPPSHNSLKKDAVDSVMGEFTNISRSPTKEVTCISKPAHITLSLRQAELLFDLHDSAHKSVNEAPIIGYLFAEDTNPGQLSVSESVIRTENHTKSPIDSPLKMSETSTLDKESIKNPAKKNTETFMLDTSLTSNPRKKSTASPLHRLPSGVLAQQSDVLPVQLRSVLSKKPSASPLCRSLHTVLSKEPYAPPLHRSPTCVLSKEPDASPLQTSPTSVVYKQPAVSALHRSSAGESERRSAERDKHQPFSEKWQLSAAQCAKAIGLTSVDVGLCTAVCGPTQADISLMTSCALVNESIATPALTTSQTVTCLRLSPTSDPVVRLVKTLDRRPSIWSANFQKKTKNQPTSDESEGNSVGMQLRRPYTARVVCSFDAVDQLDSNSLLQECKEMHRTADDSYKHDTQNTFMKEGTERDISEVGKLVKPVIKSPTSATVQNTLLNLNSFVPAAICTVNTDGMPKGVKETQAIEVKPTPPHVVTKTMESDQTQDKHDRKAALAHCGRSPVQTIPGGLKKKQFRRSEAKVNHKRLKKGSTSKKLRAQSVVSYVKSCRKDSLRSAPSSSDLGGGIQQLVYSTMNGEDIIRSATKSLTSSSPTQGQDGPQKAPLTKKVAPRVPGHGKMQKDKRIRIKSSAH